MNRTILTAAGLAALMATVALAGSETPPEGPPWQRDFAKARTEGIEKGLPIFVYLTKTY